MALLARSLALLLLATGCSPAPVEAPPAALRDGLPRVVSINPCVDAVLMQVADPRQIAGISHYSQDARASSIPLDVARRFRATSGTAEEVIALAPDLVIAGSHVAPSTIAALARLGIPVIQIGVPESIAESRAQVQTIAAAVGRSARGAQLAARIDAAVAAAKGEGVPIAALIWQGGGMVPGAGTLASELLQVTGFRNVSADHGLKAWDVLPLEPLIARPPQLLLSVGAQGQEDRMLRHPVLDHLEGRIAVRPFPERLLHCGGPTIIDAVSHLARIRGSL
jgi:iron complex transport system substrate-binding protein